MKFITKNRFKQNLKTKLIGKAGQSKLSKSKILLVGAGGTGCPVLTYLYYAGVGDITICDYDNVDESNLNRQFLYKPEDIGLSKSLIACNSLPEYKNQQIKWNANPFNFYFFNPRKIKYDLIIDCTDNMETKLEIKTYCEKYNIPYIISGVHGYLIHMFCWHPKYSKKKYHEIFNVDVVSERGMEKSQGTFPTSVGILGTMIANEAMKILLNHHKYVIYNKTFYYNILINNLYKNTIGG